MSLGREQFNDFSVLRRPPTAPNPVTVHFAHATGFNANTYAPLFESLDPSIDLHAMDARGHGLTKAPANPRALRSWKPYVDDLTSLLLRLPRPVVLAGHSLGGTVSLEVAARYPGLVSGLLLVDPVFVAPKHGLWFAAARTLGLSKRVPIARVAAKRRMEFESAEAAVENFVGKGPFRTWSREWIEAYVAGGTLVTDRGVRLSCDRAWESQTFATPTARPLRWVKKLACPTTLVIPDKPRTPFDVNARDAFMGARPSTRLVEVALGTHFMAMERPDILREEIERLVVSARS